MSAQLLGGYSEAEVLVKLCSLLRQNMKRDQKYNGNNNSASRDDKSLFPEKPNAGQKKGHYNPDII